jgi:hypothetical protein
MSPRTFLHLLAFSLLLTVAACAHSKEMKRAVEIRQLLSAAGFTTKLADTPEKMEKLRAMEQRQLLAHSLDGGVYYTYADAEGCGCLMAGDEKAYQEFNRLATERRIAEDYRKAAEARERTAMDWGYWGPWPWW